MANVNKRPDHIGPNRNVYEKNRKRILATQDVCGICGQPVNKSLPATHPLGPVIDHIVPIKHGGHPSDIDNLQLAHNFCNRRKSDHVQPPRSPEQTVIPNNVLPHSVDWKNF